VGGQANSHKFAERRGGMRRNSNSNWDHLTDDLIMFCDRGEIPLFKLWIIRVGLFERPSKCPQNLAARLSIFWSRVSLIGKVWKIHSILNAFRESSRRPKKSEKSSRSIVNIQSPSGAISFGQSHRNHRDSWNSVLRRNPIWDQRIIDNNPVAAEL
jgi:hypothetical protein